MKTKQLLFSLTLLAILCLGSCKKKKKTDNVFVHEQPTMVDVVGKYRGDIPCDDCDKRIITLDLLMDKTAYQTISKVGGEGGSVSENGTWELKASDVQLNLNDKTEFLSFKSDELQYKLGGQLYVLTKEEK